MRELEPAAYSSVAALLTGYGEAAVWHAGAIRFFLTERWIGGGAAGRSLHDLVREAWAGDSLPVPDIRTRPFGYPQAVPRYGVPAGVFRRIARADNWPAREWLRRHGASKLLEVVRALSLDSRARALEAGDETPVASVAAGGDEPKGSWSSATRSSSIRLHPGARPRRRSARKANIAFEHRRALRAAGRRHPHGRADGRPIVHAEGLKSEGGADPRAARARVPLLASASPRKGPASPHQARRPHLSATRGGHSTMRCPRRPGRRAIGTMLLAAVSPFAVAADPVLAARGRQPGAPVVPGAVRRVVSGDNGHLEDSYPTGGLESSRRKTGGFLPRNRDRSEAETASIACPPRRSSCCGAPDADGPPQTTRAEAHVPEPYAADVSPYSTRGGGGGGNPHLDDGTRDGGRDIRSARRAAVVWGRRRPERKRSSTSRPNPRRRVEGKEDGADATPRSHVGSLARCSTADLSWCRLHAAGNEKSSGASTAGPRTAPSFGRRAMARGRLNRDYSSWRPRDARSVELIGRGNPTLIDRHHERPATTATTHLVTGAQRHKTGQEYVRERSAEGARGMKTRAPSGDLPLRNSGTRTRSWAWDGRRTTGRGAMA